MTLSGEEETATILKILTEGFPHFFSCTILKSLFNYFDFHGVILPDTSSQISSSEYNFSVYLQADFKTREWELFVKRGYSMEIVQRAIHKRNTVEGEL